MVNKPAFRKLRGYAFDPSLSLQTDTADVNAVTYKVEWETLEKPEKSNDAVVWPIGEYLEIIDYDPASQCFYDPVNLNDQYLLAQDGLEPSVSNPQFHQQMVYAVIMTTIKNFEKALGRKIQWSDYLYPVGSGKNKGIQSKFVRRLRVYPHALRQANAFYHPDKKALLFGYFPASPASAALQLPGGTVFTCLSHDVIAHETTHAILDGMHRRFIDPTNPDTRAFHEAFADIVALFQHFTFPEVLRQQIARTRGNLADQNLLGQLAQEFGRAVGSYGSLRDAIGETDPATGKWKPHDPSPNDLNRAHEFHNRGAILVAAVFDAFITVYKTRVKQIIRIATGGSGILGEGELHPDLVNQMANAAAKTASQVLGICVRALDYCPPIDITFGDYLRAIITADRDLVSEDDRDYRIAFIEAFQRRGIFPKGIKSMSVEALCYDLNPETGIAPELNRRLGEFLREFKDAVAYISNREEIHSRSKAFIGGGDGVAKGLHQHLDIKTMSGPAGKRFSELTGIRFERDPRQCAKDGIEFSGELAKYQVDKIWLANRISPEGRIVNHVVVNLIQKRGVIIKEKDGSPYVAGFFVPGTQRRTPEHMDFRGGCTLVFDLDNLCLRYAIKKDIYDEQRMLDQYRYQRKVSGDDAASMYFHNDTLSRLSGPFAFLHNH